MIGVLLVSHGRLGQQLLDTVTSMLGELSLATEVIGVHGEDDPDERAREAMDAAARVDSGGGVLVLTDAFGSTPSNIANRLAADNRRMVAGVNLPMLVRIYNYPELTLQEMAGSAIEGGRGGVVPCADYGATPHG